MSNGGDDGDGSHDHGDCDFEVILVADDEEVDPYELDGETWRNEKLENDINQLGRLLVWRVGRGADDELVTTLRITQLQSITKDILGGVLWDAAVVLGKYLERSAHLVEGKRVLDLGSGTGVTGLVCAALGATHVTLTEYENETLLELMRENAALNHQGGCEVAVAALSWGNDSHHHALPHAPYDVIIGSDLVYEPKHADLLLATLTALATPRTLIAISYKDRASEGLQAVPRLLEKAARHFEVLRIPRSEYHAQFYDEKLKIIKLKKKEA